MRRCSGEAGVVAPRRGHYAGLPKLRERRPRRECALMPRSRREARTIHRAACMTSLSAATRALMVAAVWAGLVPACTPAPRGRDIVLITIDTLRPDHMGLYGYERPTTPEIDRWFADGAIFERAYSTEANTSPSVVSFLSGLLPQEHRIRLIYQLLDPETRLISDRLPEAYQSAGFVSNPVLTDEAIGLASHFDHYDDFLTEWARSGGPTTDAALTWLREEREPERPVFLWVHYMDPHWPYRPPEDWKRSFVHEGKRPGLIRKMLQVDDVLEFLDLYDEEIAYMDHHVGRLLEGCSDILGLDDTLVIFTADHGESMMEHDAWFAHGYQVYEEIVRVPLMLRGPGVATGRRAGLVSGIDVAKTVLSFAGATTDPNSPALDLRSPVPIPVERTVFAEATRGGHWRAAIQLERKWVVGMKYGKRQFSEFRYYDLVADPDELNPAPAFPKDAPPEDLLGLLKADPDPGGRPKDLAPFFERRGRVPRRSTTAEAPKVHPRATEEQREMLRGLGYID